MPPDDGFAALRPRLVRIAYRMLGSVAEAEDVAQDAWLRWQGADRAGVHDARAFLTRVVTRLCLDHLASARSRRETYVGTWLPEPLIEDPGSSAESTLGERVTGILMMALERLSPLERAAFLLHDVFDLPFDEVAATVERSPAACRQLAARARAHLRGERPRFAIPADRGEAVARAFLSAAADGDVAQLRAMLAEDVVAYQDGGGKRPATINPIIGRDKVLRFLVGIAGKQVVRTRLIAYRQIDGLPGAVLIDGAGVLQTTALAIEADRVVRIFTVRNPDKLRHVEVEATPRPERLSAR